MALKTRNELVLLIASMVFLLNQAQGNPSTTDTLLRGANHEDKDSDLLTPSDISVHDEVNGFADDELPFFQTNLLSGAFVGSEHFFQDPLVESQIHGRALSVEGKTCVTEQSNIDYFEIKLHMSATDTPFDCKVADTIMLGHNINRLLWNYGIGIQEEFDQVIFLAGVCPKPEALVRDRRALLKRTPTKFVYAGFGACRYCGSDNYDRRSLVATEWFQNEFKPQLETRITNAIRDELVLLHENCLGGNPGILVNITGREMTDVTNVCGKDKAMATDQIGFLESYNFADVLLNPIIQTNCTNCVKIDWSTTGNGDKVRRGSYVKDEWREKYKLQVTAYPTGRKGYAPSNKARIFDSSNPGLVSDDDLGSPNSSCPGGGPGKGIGGRVGRPGENCVSVGNILIIEESSANQEPDDSSTGGIIEFKFGEPVLFADIGLMDFEESGSKIILEYWDGVKEMYAFRGYGDNGVQRVVTNKQNIRGVQIVLPGSGAVTEINFCPPCK